MATRPPQAGSSSSRTEGKVDLGRLRIDRSGDGRARGFPWIRLLLVAGVIGGLWLFREPLLALVEDARAPEVEVARAVKVQPGAEAEGDVAANGYVVADR